MEGKRQVRIWCRGRETQGSLPLPHGGLNGGGGKDAQKGDTENEIKKKADGTEGKKNPEVFRMPLLELSMPLLELSMELCPLTMSRKVRKGTHHVSRAASFRL